MAEVLAHSPSGWLSCSISLYFAWTILHSVFKRKPSR